MTRASLLCFDVAEENRSDFVAVKLRASRDSLYRTGRGERQHRAGGDPVGPPVAAMSRLS
jgi:hypothetical protein